MAYGSPAVRGAGDGRRMEMKGVFSDRDRRRRGVFARSLLFGRLVSPNSGGFWELDTLEMSEQSLVEKYVFVFHFY
jgi:hypothetical protein